VNPQGFEAQNAPMSDDRSKSSLEDALRVVWQEHRMDVLEHIALIDRAAEALQTGELDEQRRADAKRAAHMLAGSIGTFGFVSASEAARELEREFASPTPARVSRIFALVAAVRRGIAEEVITPESQQSGESAPSLGRVLVVDDDVKLCERIVAEATSLGIECDTATSPAQARELCKGRPPAIVLLDLTFPPDGVTDAYELLSELSSASPPIPVLILTVSDAFIDRVEAARRGARAFLTKSLLPAEVLDAVGQFLARERLQATRVLIVDDDPMVLDTMRALLEPHDLEITTITDPLSFWETLEEVAPEMLILDVDMPGVNGPELCRVVRNDPRWSRLAVIFVTANSDAATAELIFSAGADDHLSKPISGPELITRVTNRLERIRLYRAQADTDSLTGLATRAKSSEGLTQLATLADRFSEPLSVAMVDIDRFKLINDSYGHATGDTVLRRLGERLRRDFRGNDVVGRRGGEEFLIGMYGMTRGDAMRRLTGTLERFREEEFDGGQETFSVTFSAGVAEYPLDGHDLSVVYHSADEALYRAKAAGRARIVATDATPASV
jgi:diguanylate cyclase (GGDEF)-like protein